jgi:hypothetical protein
MQSVGQAILTAAAFQAARPYVLSRPAALSVKQDARSWQTKASKLKINERNRDIHYAKDLDAK